MPPCPHYINHPSKFHDFDVALKAFEGIPNQNLAPFRPPSLKDNKQKCLKFINNTENLGDQILNIRNLRDKRFHRSEILQSRDLIAERSNRSRVIQIDDSSLTHNV